MLYQLVFYVPESHLESVKEAVFEAGGGCFGGYDRCCWQTKGQGQFRPLAGSQPYLGSTGVVETLEEYRVELVVDAASRAAAVAALKAAHPYEEPAYAVWRIEAP